VIILALAGSVALAILWSCSRTPVRPDIVLIIVDALRPDYLGCYGYDRPTSPRIDALARESIVFDAAVAQAPWTKPSFSSILTSLYPFQHGVIDWESVMPDSVATLPEVLRASGYATMGIINMLAITDEYKVTKGIDKLSSAPKHQRDAAAVTNLAEEFISASERPFFILIHYHDTHYPYKAAAEYVDQVLRPGDRHPSAGDVVKPSGTDEVPPESAIARQKLLYSACVRQSDAGIGKLLDWLDGRGLRKNAVVVITADHGEEFWEHGKRAHASDVYDSQLRIPLIISYPAKYKHPRRVSSQVSHVDLMPTLVELTGARDTGWREGTSLTALMEGREPASAKKTLPAGMTLSELDMSRGPVLKCVRTSEWKLILEPPSTVVQLYDLQDDPGETNDLWRSGGRMADSLLSVIMKIPGSSIGGWRLAMTGRGAEADLGLDVKLGRGARLAGVRSASTPGNVSLGVAGDSSSFRLGGRPDVMYLVLFDVVPDDAEVSVGAVARGEDAPAEVCVGGSTRKSLPASLVLTRDAALGLPDTFIESRAAGEAGLYVWWSPGGEVREAGRHIGLSPEEIKRLRALGYVQ
jgi:choline-sulfatase